MRSLAIGHLEGFGRASLQQLRTETPPYVCHNNIECEEEDVC